ncbi:MAG: transporter substrate-binding domain-containing protein, partial [Clostridia bacterium]
MRKRNAGIGAFLIGLLVWWGITSGVWAEGNPIRVGFFPIRGFYEQDAQGRRSGYGVEYLNRLAGVTGWTYEYVDVQTWQEALACLVKGQIDLLAPVQITPERQEQFAFSAYAVGIAYGGILALDTNDALVYEDFDALSHAKIGCVETATFRGPFIRYIAEHGITPTMTYYPGTDAMYAALNAGEVDAIVVNLMTQTENTKLLGKFGAAPFYYMLNQRDTALQETLAQALSQIKTHEPTLEVALTAQYYPQYTVL